MPIAGVFIDYLAIKKVANVKSFGFLATSNYLSDQLSVE